MVHRRVTMSKKKSIYFDKKHSPSFLNQALSVLDQIVQEKIFVLLNQTLSEEIIAEMYQLIPKMIPFEINSIFLVDNFINEVNLQKLIHCLSCTSSLHTLVIIRNEIGSSVLRALSDHVAQNTCLSGLKRLALKDSRPPKYRPAALNNLLKAISTNSDKMRHLCKLTLSQIGLDKECLLTVGRFVVKIPSIQHVDVSANALDGRALSAFMVLVAPKNGLKSLNLDYNSLKNCPESLGLFKAKPESFEASTAQLLANSSTMLHLSLNCLELSFHQLMYIAHFGVKRSLSLQSIHVNGLQFSGSEHLEFKKEMKIADL